jgi:pSer/pThr/pTyr-binding forkhead associated (FHA) protein
LPVGKRVSLAFLTGPRSGEIYVLQHPAALIGRQGGGGGAHIELQDTEVSRAHAVLDCHGSRFVVRDLQSTNGTLVDGQRIRERELENRGEFQVGSSRIMLIVADAE